MYDFEPQLRRSTDKGKELPIKERLAKDTQGLAIRCLREDQEPENLTFRSNDAKAYIKRLIQDAKVKIEELVAEATKLSETVTTTDLDQLTSGERQRALYLFKKRTDIPDHFRLLLQWEDIEASLNNSPEAIWKIAQMEAAGHAPSIFAVTYDKDLRIDYYFVGTCSREVPESTRMDCYDKSAELFANIAGTWAEGVQTNAIDGSAKMGLQLFPPELYELLNQEVKFDQNSATWLQTSEGVRTSSEGLAFIGTNKRNESEEKKSIVRNDFAKKLGLPPVPAKEEQRKVVAWLSKLDIGWRGYFKLKHIDPE